MLFLAVEGGNALFAAFENNLFNWIVLLIGLVWLWNKVMPGLFESRQQHINASLANAAKTKEEAQHFLHHQEERVRNAEAEAQKILDEAKKVAHEMKQQIKEQTAADSVEFERKTAQQIEMQRHMAITQLRSQAAILAVRLAEASLPGAITADLRKGLHKQFVKQLDTIGNQR